MLNWRHYLRTEKFIVVHLTPMVDNLILMLHVDLMSHNTISYAQTHMAINIRHYLLKSHNSNSAIIYQLLETLPTNVIFIWIFFCSGHRMDYFICYNVNIHDIICLILIHNRLPKTDALTSYENAGKIIQIKFAQVWHG